MTSWYVSRRSRSSLMTRTTAMDRSRAQNVPTAVKGLHRSHGAHELKIVVIGVRQGGDQSLIALIHAVGLANDCRARSHHSVEFGTNVGGLDIPDEPPRLGVLPGDLIVGADGDPAGADLPSGVAPVAELWFPEDPGVVVGQALRIIGSDQDAVEVHVCLLQIGRAHV